MLLYLLYQDWQQRPVKHAHGILVPDTPEQVNNPPDGFELNDYQLTKKALFEIRARVLSSEPYYFRRESDLSPLDLALGWGVMSDQGLLDQLDVSQSSRWYRWKYAQAIPVSDHVGLFWLFTLTRNILAAVAIPVDTPGQVHQAGDRDQQRNRTE